MTKYILRRILLALPTVLIVMFMTFMMLRIVPGSLVDTMMADRPYATAEDRAKLEQQLGLDEPIPQQFAKYVWNVAHGDLGVSPWTTTPVTDELKRRLPVTAEFGVMAILIGLCVSLPVGIISAIRQDTISDYVARSFSILALSVPYFFSATILIVFGPKWGWTPPLIYKSWTDGPLPHLYYFLAPATLLGLALAGGVMRLTRTMMLEVLRQDYIRTAWAKGLRERSVIYRHAMKNALIPVITIVGLQVGTAVSGTIILETIFNMPGVGRFFVGAILQRDYPSVQGVVLVLASVIVVVNLIVDLSYAWLDPRIRYS
ncbi:MAG TPA: ABC transporter permease [Tepidiformaceae bacterium]|nr:ABC transporter permease [Tepidiformaceae bacterium]HNO65369.1 ABC transporter permease [Tepidiformaceae bacterium]